jgi:hypothetical protein
MISLPTFVAVMMCLQVPDVEDLLDKTLGKGGAGGDLNPAGGRAGGGGGSAGGSADGGGGSLHGGQPGGAAGGAGGGPLNEVDTFGAKLNSILAADLTAVALAQGSLDTIPLGPLATLMPLLQMAGQLNDPTIKSALKQVGGGVGCWGAAQCVVPCVGKGSQGVLGVSC